MANGTPATSSSDSEPALTTETTLPTTVPVAASAAIPTPASFRPMKVPWEIGQFDGTYVTSYLQRYNLLAEDCNLQGAAKLRRFTAYCTYSVIPEVESLPGNENGDWNTFEKALKRRFFHLDPLQKQYQVPYLRTLAEQQKKGGDLQMYTTQFLRIVKVLINNGKISHYTACAEFYGGLTEQIQLELQRRLNTNWTNVEGLNAETIIQGVIDMGEERIERRNLMCCTAPPIPIQPPVQYSNSPHVPQQLHPPQNAQSHDPVGQTPHNFTPAPAPKQNQVDDLASMLNKLSLSMAEMTNVIKTQQQSQNQQRQYSPQNIGNTTRFGGPNQYSAPPQQYQQTRQPRGAPNTCAVCGEEGHWKNTCQVLNDLIQKGIVHMKNDRMIYLGRTGDTMVNRLGHRTIRDAAMAAYNQNGPRSTPPAPVSSVVAYRPNPYLAEVAEPAPINSIYATVGALGYADVDAAEKRKAVQPAAPQKRQAMDGAFHISKKSGLRPVRPDAQGAQGAWR